LGKRRFSIAEPALIALESLRAHKLRSFLTLFGVIIAVTTLIAVISMVKGMRTAIAERLVNFGTNVFYINRYGFNANFQDFLEALKRNPKITLEDYEFLRDHMKLAEQVGAQDRVGKEVRYGREIIERVSIRGVTANMVFISSEKVGSGRYFTESEYRNKSQVAFVGTDIPERLFPGLDPLGRTIQIDGLPFEIVGVAEKVGSVLGQSQDNFVYIPVTTQFKIWGTGPADDTGPWIGVKCRTPEQMERAKDEARTLMRARRRQAPLDKDRFGIVSSETVASLWDQIFGTLAVVAVGLTAVFLVIGGIVIMNIMMASVTERTREIGIRKSLGARRRDILLQFLVESSVMSLVGGALGVFFAFVATELISALTPVPVDTPLSAVVTALGVCGAVGMFFGLWPAVKAARLDPVVALRAE
jgi:putative ABC transport system permease protein